MTKLGEELKKIKSFHNGEYCNGEYYYEADVDKVVKETFDKIREEIEQDYYKVYNDYNQGYNHGLYKAIRIIDKYMGEKESKNARFLKAVQEACNELGIDKHIKVTQLTTCEIKANDLPSGMKNIETKDGVEVCFDGINFCFYENEECCDYTLTKTNYGDNYLKLTEAFKKASKLSKLVTFKMAESEE